MNMMENSIIPENEKGKSVDLEHTVTASSITEAKKLFQLVRNRLQHPGKWHELTGTLGATFTVRDAGKNVLHRPVAVNDFIQIDLPAPGTDWVKVTAIDRDTPKAINENFAVTVEVAPEPGIAKDGVDHFFEEGASSTFMVKRKNKTVIVSYHGRNEIPNTDKLRNTIVAWGAMAGLSELQWNALLKGLVEQEEP